MQQKLSFFQKLDLLKPSKEEMLKEISQSGLVIKLENGDVNGLIEHQEELISTMWKLVQMEKLMESKDLFSLLEDQLPDISTANN